MKANEIKKMVSSNERDFFNEYVRLVSNGFSELLGTDNVSFRYGKDEISDKYEFRAYLPNTNGAKNRFSVYNNPCKGEGDTYYSIWVGYNVIGHEDLQALVRACKEYGKKHDGVKIELEKWDSSQCNIKTHSFYVIYTLLQSLFVACKKATDKGKTTQPKQAISTSKAV
jgi:hypothetical protein